MSFQLQVRKGNKERLLYGNFLLIKYTLILVYNFLDHFDFKVLGIH